MKLIITATIIYAIIGLGVDLYSDLEVSDYNIHSGFLEVIFVFKTDVQNSEVTTIMLPFTSNLQFDKDSHELIVSDYRISHDTLYYHFESQVSVVDFRSCPDKHRAIVREFVASDVIRVRKKPIKFKMLFTDVDFIPKYLSIPIMLNPENEEQSKIVDFVCQIL